MKPGRGAGVVIACLVLAVSATACGIGPGKDVGGVDLNVTRDYGAKTLLSDHVSGLHESDTVLRVLDRSAHLTTRYGGKFVQSIDGISGGNSGGRPFDWFFYVNGVESEVGAADVSLSAGDRIWWDYHDWGAAMRAPAVVGSWPEPFLHGYPGHADATVSVRCEAAAMAACHEVRRRLGDAGVAIASRSGSGDVRVLVGSWADVRSDPAARGIEAGPGTSGVFADFARTGRGYSLQALDTTGAPARTLGPDAGLVAATRRFDGPPTWVVTGGTAAAAEKAAELLDTSDLRDDFAVATARGSNTPLPVP